MKNKIYIDTSVIGGYFDEEFEEPTKDYLTELQTRLLKFIFQKLMKQN